MRKAASVIVLLLLLTACGGTDPTDPAARPTATPAEPGARGDDPADVELPEGVEAAPEDGVNVPAAGSYVYAFSGQSTSAARPTASPVRAPADAEFTSEVAVEGSEVTMTERTSFGSTVATTRYRFDEERIAELSIRTESSAGTVGCDLTTPIDLLRIPIEEGSYGEQNYEGDGAACDRTKEVEVVRREVTTDDEGRRWSTWVLEVRTVGRSPGLTEEFTETIWFSPDLGKNIRTEVETVGIDADGEESYRAQTRTLLRSYPS